MNALPLGQIFNLEPEPGEPARLGIAIVGLVKNEASISLRPDGGLDSTIARTPDRRPAGELDGPDARQRLHDAADVVRAGHRHAERRERDAFTPTGCDQRAVHAHGRAPQLETTQRAVPSGATVTLTLPEGDAHVRRTEIVLPRRHDALAGRRERARGLHRGAVRRHRLPGARRRSAPSASPRRCSGRSPARSSSATNFRLYVVVDGQRRAGQARRRRAPGPGHGPDHDRSSTTCRRSRSRRSRSASRAARERCCRTRRPAATKALTADADALERDRAEDRERHASRSTGGCTAAAFAPGAAGRGRLDRRRAPGRRGDDGDHAARRRAETSRAVTTALPPGLAGSLKGVPVCAEAQANAGTCPAETRVGRVSALAGAGAAPVALAGTVSLTGPVDGGLAGPGDRDSRAASARSTSAPSSCARASRCAPTAACRCARRRCRALVGGVPVSIRQLAFTFDRPGFILNSSSCAPQDGRARCSRAPTAPPRP